MFLQGGDNWTEVLGVCICSPFLVTIRGYFSKLHSLQLEVFGRRTSDEESGVTVYGVLVERGTEV